MSRVDEVERLCRRMLGDGSSARAAAEASGRATAKGPPGQAQGDRIARLRAAVAACRDLRPTEAREEGTDGRAPGAPITRRPGSPAVSSTAQAAAAPADAAGAQTPATGDPAADAVAGQNPAGSGSGSGSGSGDLRAAVARELATATAGLSERQRALLALRDLLELDHGEIGQVLGADLDAVALGLAQARVALRERLRGATAPAGACVERDRALRTVTRRLDGGPIAEADEDWIIEHLGLCVSCGRAHAAMLEAAACYRAWPIDPVTEAPPAAAGR
jgi:DNA-directed RNA polymerase specialized sigma24 family protein